ncbi:WXG100 family type VII secretion target [Micrococcus luteus]|jgi:WXG100 family type VII secretion target|uniref:ESAT-6-like protein n=4 Tax=Micrococcus TaxID=1269 RepID=C5C901_MICLC|nr:MULTISPECIES: WXG100 family type VII secretion target [Micrococcus]MBD4392580.1 WXG100 family type VII secretion target [Xanthomonas citri pv. citri]OFT02012.1 type VII secretion protein [Micrococcus sp. HMSC30C05]OOL26661.1 type VII secretion protein [Rhodococcus rhodochrous]PFH06621.1 WXG100 family type VII secretion target [Micrococcaceae bacterium JKS001869]TFI05384.1 WXG100 family type VII secretion target [Thiopseudomonas sp. 4R-3cl]
MSIVQIDVEDLRAKSGAVEGSIGRLQAEVSTMEANLRQLQDTWRGQAAANFQGVLTEWRATQQRVEESLAGIRRAMDAAATQYQDAETANAAMFRF